MLTTGLGFWGLLTFKTNTYKLVFTYRLKKYYYYCIYPPKGLSLLTSCSGRNFNCDHCLDAKSEGFGLNRFGEGSFGGSGGSVASLWDPRAFCCLGRFGAIFGIFADLRFSHFFSFAFGFVISLSIRPTKRKFSHFQTCLTREGHVHRLRSIIENKPRGIYIQPHIKNNIKDWN